MAKSTSKSNGRTAAMRVETLVHEQATRKNIPTAEYQSIMQKDDQESITVVYKRNRDLDPQLMWRGKDEQNSSDLVAAAPPLYIQEKVHPKVLIDDLLRKVKAGQLPEDQMDLFSDFNGLPSDGAKTEFYQHDSHWSNRMILGDSLQVMASLSEREGLRGKVQCIYFDPPYGITFNSNFQWSTTSREVKDGAVQHITREPEQVKAFRDTWRDGIHSYLTYLRDRLVVARDLLTDSGSIFVQIGDENVHRVRAVLDEVFGETSFITEILVKKKGSQKGGTLDAVNDYILWYGKSAKTSGQIKIRPIYEVREDEEIFEDFPYVELENGERLAISELEERDGEKYRIAYKTFKAKYPKAKLFALNPMKSGGDRKRQSLDFVYHGRTFPIKPGQCWKHTVIEDDQTTPGMTRLGMAERLYPLKTDVRFIRHSPTPSIREISNWWDGFGGASNPVYVVQTNERVVERCILMATDPGDLVLDPTCGSGTTATVSELWARRWITIDTSRVALALARARIMGSKYPYFILADSAEGRKREAELTGRIPPDRQPSRNVREGFVYERAFNVTSGSIANNPNIEVIFEKARKQIEPLLEKLKNEISPKSKDKLNEWDLPDVANDKWGAKAKAIFLDVKKAISKRREEMNASIAARADYEILYDRPHEDKKIVRVAGPFTVESVSPHRSLTVDENDGLVQTNQTLPPEAIGKTDFAGVIIENLRNSGVQQAHKEDKIVFTSLSAWPGQMISAEGFYVEKGSSKEKRAAIFIGPEFGTVSRPDLVEAAKEAGDADFDVLIACAFNYDARSADFSTLGRVPVLKARMNADLHMADDLKNTGKGNLFVVFGEPDIEIKKSNEELLKVKINGVDVFHPNTGEVKSDGADGIACWFLDTDYNEESFFVRHAYFLGASDPYKALKTSLKAEIDEAAWESLYSDVSRSFKKPDSGRIAVKVINHLGDEVMKVFKVN